MWYFDISFVVFPITKNVIVTVIRKKTQIFKISLKSYLTILIEFCSREAPNKTYCGFHKIPQNRQRLVVKGEINHKIGYPKFVETLRLTTKSR